MRGAGAGLWNVTDRHKFHPRVRKASSGKNSGILSQKQRTTTSYGTSAIDINSTVRGKECREPAPDCGMSLIDINSTLGSVRLSAVSLVAF